MSKVGILATYRDWEISRSLVSYTRLTDFVATHRDYDPTPNHLYDGPSDNRIMHAESIAQLCADIDIWYEDQE